MKLKELENPIETLSGVGPSTASNFAKLNIFKICDLLQYYPRSYEDRTKTSPLKDYSTGEKIHSIVQVVKHDWFGFGRMRTLKLIISDGQTNASLVCFNRPFMEKMFPVGSIIAVTGRYTFQYGQIQSSSFDAEKIATEGNLSDFQNGIDPTAKMLAIYPLTSGLTQSQIRKAVKQSLKMYARGIDDELPIETIERQNLMHKKDAINAIHSAQTQSEIEKAIRTLKFEELYFFQEAILKQARERKNNPKINFTEKLVDLSPRQKILLASLPFELTSDQKSVINILNAEIDESIKSTACNTDIKQNFTIARLIQGDVGSGKTLVAFFASLRIIDWGGQVCLLAPTELLARQHAENASKLLEKCDINVSFLTGNLNSKGRNQLLASIKSGQTQFIVGTHAVFSKNVQYKNLQLAIIDEQHRFGVVQRNLIKEKCSIENILMMSATPIPQSLAQVVFSNLDVSTIKSMPKGRLPIKTHLTKPGNENTVYEAVRSELKLGHQAYFVYPRIGSDFTENDMSNGNAAAFFSTPDGPDGNNSLKNAEDMCAFLGTQVYPQYKTALIHSKIPEEEQNAILSDFRDGKIQVLVATTVVEVGVDVPNATCIVIEHADRFGLAELHQLRGRVGRGTAQSYCILIYSKNITAEGIQRMKILRQNTDGFKIAEEDLKLRGPGQIAGTVQAGYLTLGIADLVRDKEMLLKARTDAFSYLQSEKTKPHTLQDAQV